MTSESSNPLDAYQPPKPVESEAGPVMRKTGRIKAICIIAIVLGCLGLFSALAGTVGLMFGKQIQSAVSPPNQPGVNQEMIRVQEEMQKDLQSVQDRFLAINAILVVLLALVAFGLLVGGIQSLRRVPPARKILLGACSAALVYELIRTARDIAIQAQTIPMTLEHTERMMSAGNGPPGVADFAMTAARVGVVVGILFGAAWVLAKLVFFSISVWYLRKPAVCAYLDGHDVAPQFNDGFPT
jgi:hypothetical protein